MSGTDYYALASLVERMWAGGNQEAATHSSQALASSTERTLGQTADLLRELDRLRIATADAQGWFLTPAGRAWASVLADSSRTTHKASRRDCHSFTDYLPTEWWPNGK